MSAAEQATADAWTIRRMVKWMTDDFTKRGIDTPRLDAELLVGSALGVPRVRLYLDLDRPLDSSELKRIRELVARRRGREPVAYILGRREFYGRSFRVNNHVLIPRPDTETLVERASQIIDAKNIQHVWDLCTGSGAVGLSILAERSEVTCTLTDISEPALRVAKENAAALGVAERASFTCGDTLAPLEDEAPARLICANPPYVRRAELLELSAEIRDYEPHLALAAGEDGLDFFRKVLPSLKDVLAEDGTALFECGRGQAPEIEALARASGFDHIQFHNDLTGVARVAELSVTSPT